MHCYHPGNIVGMQTVMLFGLGGREFHYLIGDLLIDQQCGEYLGKDWG